MVAELAGGELDVRTALCFPNLDRPRWLGLTMRSGTIVMDAPPGVAKLAGLDSRARSMTFGRGAWSGTLREPDSALRNRA